MKNVCFRTVLAGLACAAAGAAELGDPAAVAPPPADAVGFPGRTPDLDALPGFRQPPPGYGEVAFFWWLGDPLTKERLTWQLDRLAEAGGISGLQINYAHSDRGGQSYGLTYPSDPPLFSEAWWDLVGWFMGEARKRGMAVSLSDYTLGIGQGWAVDGLLAKQPELAGSVLQHASRDAAAGEEVRWSLPPGTLALTAYPLDAAGAVAGPGVDLRPHVRDGELRWRAPAARHRIAAVSVRAVVPSLDPMNPASGPAYADAFFGPFDRRNPGQAGKGLNFFFSDELGFGVAGNLWTARFADEFRRRKGYDLVPELPALFADVGPRTPKVRLDYGDVKVALTEEGFFKPVFDWHQQRGMIYGCDHGGRGRNVTEFGDYFRTQRWNQGPGCDQPHLGRDLVKNKVASSIAHLYLRPRVWLEGYYGSGWGTSSEQIADATFANFAQGQNLLTLHGLYYSTHGGFWEWAPPCNHFRMPYWAHMRGFMTCVQRLSYLLSQGYHRCDVAILYPVAPVEAGVGGAEAVAAAFEAGRQLYAGGVDFDFMDFESLARARIADGRLEVSGEAYRALVLPAMRAARWSTVLKADEFRRAGGHLFVVGAPPEASDRAGRDDSELTARVKAWPKAVTPAELAAAVPAAFPPDFAAAGASPSFLHRRIGPRDVWMVYGAPKGTECAFRAVGRAELWDPWTGRTRPLPVRAQENGRTRLALPLTEKEAQLIVFGPGQPEYEKAGAPPAVRELALDGDWDFELAPTLDNRWGDFRWPPTQGLLGAEARRFRTSEETAPAPGREDPAFDDSKWPTVTASFGPKFWKLGPLPATADLDAALAALARVDPSAPVEAGGRRQAWQPLAFSWRWGVEDDPGHQGYHGLKENVTDEFICLGAPKGGRNETLYVAEPGGTRYYLWTSVPSDRDRPAWIRAGGLKPSAVWVNGRRCAGGEVALKAGSNPVLLRYDQPGRGSFVLDATPGAAGDAPAAAAEEAVFSGAASWIWYPEDKTTAERWFRRSFVFDAAPAKARLRITCDNGYAVSVNGAAVGSGGEWSRVQEYDVTRRLRAGTNEIVVRARNEGDSAGLIAELTAGPLRLGTDASWRSSKTAEGATAAAEVISAFAGSLWATHPHGPPRLDAVPAAAEPGEPPRFEVSPLTMKWNAMPGRLPFDPDPLAPRVGWYRFTAPPGLRAMTIPARGKVRAWVGGREVPVRDGKAVVAAPAPSPAVVALRIEQEPGERGGAAIPEPVALDCGPGRLPAGDWSAVGVLVTYSGGAWYRRDVALTEEQARGKLTLDLGDLVSSVEVRLNGKPAGVRVAPPWRFDLTGLARAGGNRLEVLVCNTLGNHYVTIPTHYRGMTKSGLIGPARLEIE